MTWRAISEVGPTTSTPSPTPALAATPAGTAFFLLDSPGDRIRPCHYCIRGTLERRFEEVQGALSIHSQNLRGFGRSVKKLSDVNNGALV